MRLLRVTKIYYVCPCDKIDAILLVIFIKNFKKKRRFLILRHDLCAILYKYDTHKNFVPSSKKIIEKFVFLEAIKISLQFT